MWNTDQHRDPDLFWLEHAGSAALCIILAPVFLLTFKSLIIVAQRRAHNAVGLFSQFI